MKSNDLKLRLNDLRISKTQVLWAAVVGLLAERSLLTPEIRGSNLTKLQNFEIYLPCIIAQRRQKNKENVTGNGPLKCQGFTQHKLV